MAASDAEQSGKCYSCGEEDKPVEECTCGEYVCEWCSRIGGHNGLVGRMGYIAHLKRLPTQHLLDKPHCCDAFILTGVHHVKCRATKPTVSDVGKGPIENPQVDL